MKGTVTRMEDKTIKVISAGLATVLPRKQVLVLLHSEIGRRVTGIPGGTSQPIIIIFQHYNEKKLY